MTRVATRHLEATKTPIVGTTATLLQQLVQRVEDARRLADNLSRLDSQMREALGRANSDAESLRSTLAEAERRSREALGEVMGAARTQRTLQPVRASAAGVLPKPKAAAKPAAKKTARATAARQVRSPRTRTAGGAKHVFTNPKTGKQYEYERRETPQEARTFVEQEASRRAKAGFTAAEMAASFNKQAEKRGWEPKKPVGLARMLDSLVKKGTLTTGKDSNGNTRYTAA